MIDIILHNIFTLFKTSSHNIKDLVSRKCLDKVAFVSKLALVRSGNCKPATGLFIRVSDNWCIDGLIILGYAETRVVAGGYKGYFARFVWIDLKLLGYLIFECV